MAGADTFESCCRCRGVLGSEVLTRKGGKRALICEDRSRENPMSFPRPGRLTMPAQRGRPGEPAGHFAGMAARGESHGRLVSFFASWAIRR